MDAKGASTILPNRAEGGTGQTPLHGRKCARCLEQVSFDPGLLLCSYASRSFKSRQLLRKTFGQNFT